MFFQDVKGVFLVALCGLIIVGCGAKKRDSDVLKVGVCADYKPFEFFEDGKIVGFDIDLFDEVAKRLGKTAQYEDMSFDAILGALNAGRIDASISSISITQERQKNYDFSIPYLKGEYALIVKKDSSCQSIKDISDQTIGFQAGTTYEARYENELKKAFPNLKAQVMQKIPDLLQTLRSGRIQAILVGRSEAACIIAGITDLKMVPIGFDTPGEEDPGIAFKKNSPLTPQVNQVLNDMEKDGTIKTLKKKWGIQQ
ncbi:MAG: ABC transporter substrate-binding protein [Alphaproteobacteria bacterium]|nr:ABC transporter substrate-binding protein [Alphaproteobacteria bacterium]